MIFQTLFLSTYFLVQAPSPELLSQNQEFWVEKLQSDSRDIRINAIQKLEGLRSPEVISKIAPVLGDEDASVRFSAIRALGKIPTEEGLGFLKTRVDAEEDPYLKSEIKRSIRTIEDFLKAQAEKLSQKPGQSSKKK